MLQSPSEAEALFELGRLYQDRGDFFLALEKLEAASAIYLSFKDFTNYVQTVNRILRLYAETEQQEKVNLIKEKLQDLVIKEGLQLNSRTYYTLALCSFYKEQDESAMEYLQKALSLALAQDNKEDICYAISGTANVFARMGKYNEALRELYNLEIFFQVMDQPELKMSSTILNGWILTQMGKNEQAIEILWQAYDLVKSHKTLTMHYYVLYNLGRAYLNAGEKDLARTYLTLAARSVDPQNLKRLYLGIKQELAKLGDEVSEFDLKFDIETHTVLEKRIGKVDFKNQFILLDLLKLFALNQGRVYSKEYLVEQVWKQAYDPGVHDNKIYVTIKRLRKLIEPDYDKPKYIFRAKNGYFMNKSARVLVDNQGVRQQ
jgi:tetratricopeptide (TPR) repeat protein